MLAVGAAWYERVVNERPYQFEWDEAKAAANERKHDVPFELASSVFYDPHLLTVVTSSTAKTRRAGFPSASPAMAWCCRWYIYGRRPIPQ